MSLKRDKKKTPFIPGNQLWKNRLIHGPSPIYTSKTLATKAEEYFQWSDDSPIYTLDYKGTKATPVEIPHARPYTQSGLCVFLGITEDTFRNYSRTKDSDKHNEGETDMFEVCSRITQIIRTQKFDGAAVGIFNHAIIARDLGLKDRTDITTDDKPIQDLSRLSPEEKMEGLRLSQKAEGKDKPGEPE